MSNPMSKLGLSLCAALLAACQSGPQPAPVEKPGSADAKPSSGGAASGAAPAGTPASPSGAESAPAATAAQTAKAGEQAAAAAGQSAVATARPVPAGAPAFDESLLDKSVKPCDDFYQFACGGWLKKTEIPADRASWGRSFSEIGQRNELVLKDILESNAAGKPDDGDPFAQKVGDYYDTCMSEEKAETASLATLKESLSAIEGVKDPKALAKQVARLHLTGAGALFRFTSDQDAKDATQVIGSADQGGLGLPDRDFYLKDDARMQGMRKAYQTYAANMLVLLGDQEKDAQAEAAVIVEVETALAKASQDKVERRDPYKVYHRIDRKGLVGTSKDFPWSVYFAELGQPDLQAINVVAPDFFKGVGQLVAAKGKLGELKTYLRWRALASAAPTLGKKFVDENFAFTSKLTGAKQLLPRWKRCVAATDRALGEAVGRSFIAKSFGPQGKPMSKEVMKNVEDAFEANLATLSWMDDATKKASAEKLHKIVNKIGYPDKWRDYTSMQLDRSSGLKNAMAAAEFEKKRDLAKIGKPVDREEFGMSPATVNAQYNAALNEMDFPAGILQYPFFSADSAPPGNYGGIGMVMGHELTHGFDDEGRQYDADGNLRDWWSKESGEAYKTRAECVARQYDGYIAVEDQHLNGHLTLGENIADVGGLKMTYLAFQALRKGQPELPALGGFNQDQQLFLAFAQTWCTNYRPEMARLQAQTNPHSTAQWRINGPTSDSSEFAKAFSCAEGSKMAPKDRCQVW